MEKTIQGINNATKGVVCHFYTNVPLNSPIPIVKERLFPLVGEFFTLFYSLLFYFNNVQNKSYGIVSEVSKLYI